MSIRFERLRCFVSTLTFFVLTIVSQRCDANPPKPLRVLIVTGGCCHDYPVQRELLKKRLELRAYLDVETVYQGGTSSDSRIELYEKENWSDDFDVVIHDECFAGVSDNAWTKRILKPHLDGLPAVVMHCGMHCYRDGTQDWFEFCGVTSFGHGPHYPHEVLTRDAEHPIMRTLGAGWANPEGELYHIEKVWPNARSIASAKSRERGDEHTVAWVNEYGPKSTRVFGTTLGHHNATVEHPAFLDLVTRGTLWACGRLTDEYLKPPVPQQIAVNVARGKVASALTEESDKGNFAARAFDGNESTRWCASSPTFPQSLQVDLGESRPIHGIDLRWESGQIYFYQLHGSIDGNDWMLLADRSNADQPIHHEDVTANVRYVKLTVTGSNQGGWASLYELRIIGSETVTIDPQSARIQAEEAILADVKVPNGFDATLFAAPPAVLYPVSVASSPDGVIYVSVDKNGSIDRESKRGSIYRLRDIDGDGRADESKLFVADVDSPRGLVWDRDRLYVMHPPHLSAFIDKDGDGISDEQQILVKGIAFDFKDRPADHTSNGVTLGIDGWLYLAIGDFGFMRAEGTDGRTLQFRGGGVIRVRPDGSGLELYSWGTRNILEVSVDPLVNSFTRDNTNDGDGWDIRLHHFTGLDNHGYPSFFKNFSDEIVLPLADYGGGSGCGGCYVDEPGFPAGYGQALYTADWGRDWVYRHTMTAKGATFKADQNEFVGLPRVTDIDVDGSSHLYATSWKGATFTYNGEGVGYLIRLSPQGYRPPPVLNFKTASATELVAEFRSPSHRRRMAAQRELLSRGPVFGVQAELKRLTTDSKANLASRVAAIYALTLGGSGQTVVDVPTASTVELQPWILKSISETAGVNAVTIPTTVLLAALKSANPRTRLEACLAAVRGNSIDAAVAVVPLLADADAVVAHTAFQTLVKLNASAACFAMIDQSDAAPAVRDGAFRVLRQFHDSAVVDGLIRRLAQENDAVRRRGFLTTLCRLHQQEGTWTGNSWGTRPDTTGPYFQPESWDKSTKIANVLKDCLKNASPDETAFLLTELNRHKVPLDGALEQLLSMADKDPTLVPTAIAELQRARTVPKSAVPMLRRIAQGDDTSIDQRVGAVMAWLRCNDETSFSALLTVLPKLATGEARRDLEQVWNLFLREELLSRHLELLCAKAADSKDEVSVWASAGLLALTSTKHNVSPEVLAGAQKTITELSSQAVFRLQFLLALWLSNQREHSERVLQSLTDSDPAVAQRAKEISHEWGLDLGPTPLGPKLHEMKVEEVMIAVRDLPGVSGHGEALFARLNCAKCHTVKAGEPLRGPYLPNVAKTYKRDQLAESILLPSKSLAQGFVTYLFAMNDGKSYSGFVTAESADLISIRDATGKEISLSVNEIDERVKSNVSVMPEGLVKDLTIEEFAALLAYLESLGK